MTFQNVELKSYRFGPVARARGSTTAVALEESFCLKKEPLNPGPNHTICGESGSPRPRDTPDLALGRDLARRLKLKSGRTLTRAAGLRSLDSTPAAAGPQVPVRPSSFKYLSLPHGNPPGISPLASDPRATASVPRRTDRNISCQ